MDAIVDAVRRALPDATPDAAASALVAQIPHLDSRTGAALVDRVTAELPVSTWQLDDATLDRWPEPVAERALVHVRALPPGEERILALCLVARRLTLEERREALVGILDGTLPAVTRKYTKPMSYRSSITYLVRTLPEDWQEEWILRERDAAGAERDVTNELLARRDVDRLTEGAVRNLWARIDHTPTLDGDVPFDYIGLVRHLPRDLRAQALAWIRASASDSERLLHLAELEDDLTDREREEVVETPWSPYTRGDPHTQAKHLWSVRHHLSRVSLELRRKWLGVVVSFDEGPKQQGLLALLPSLSGEDHRRAREALVASVIREGCFHTVEHRWDLLPDHALPHLLVRLMCDPYGWHRDELIGHIIEVRDPELADRCLLPLSSAVGELEPDSCLEIVVAMTPWLAERSSCAIPRALAELPVPRAARPGNPLYVIDRVLETWKDE